MGIVLQQNVNQAQRKPKGVTCTEESRLILSILPETTLLNIRVYFRDELVWLTLALLSLFKLRFYELSTHYAQILFDPC